MQFSRLGKTDLSVSRICLGTMTFDKQTSETEALRVLDAASGAGVNFIDTADGYPMGMPDLSRAGRTEEILGSWLKGKRDQFVIATKAGAQMSDDPADQGGTRAHLMEAIEGSLRRLGTDYVDLYQMHFDDTATPMDETLEALDEIVRSGKARYIGISNIEPQRLSAALQLSDRLGLVRYMSVQPRYNILYRQAEAELLPLAAAEAVGVIPYNPLAGGMLSGRYAKEDKPSIGRFSDEIGAFGAMYRQRYWTDRAFDIVQSIRVLAREYGIGLPALAIAWVLSNRGITSAIVGATHHDQLAETITAADLNLDADLLRKLEGISAGK